MATWNVLNRANQTFLHAQEACHTGIIIGDYRPRHDFPELAVDGRFAALPVIVTVEN